MATPAMQMQQQNFGPPQTGQPGGGINWMPAPPSIPGCPPGLEYLTQIDQIIVNQKVELFEAFTGVETNNKFVLRNNMGQPIYRCEEDTHCCMRVCCGTKRGFTFRMFDNSNQEVLRIVRDFKCCAGCCWCAGACNCCAFVVRVEAPPGNVIGYTRQMGSCWRIQLDVQNAEEETVFKVRGPCCACGCGDVDFPVLSSDGTTEVGKITKQWSGLAKEMFTDADNFGISFPMDLDVKMKAGLIGSLMLIDVMAMETNKSNDGADAGCSLLNILL